MRSLFQRRSPRLLAASYGVALALFAGFTGAIHHHGARSVAKQDRLGEMINVAGRQRMLSQRTAALRRLVEARSGETEAERAARDYADAVEQFMHAHERLTTGDLAWRDDHPKATALQDIYYADGLDHDVRRFVVEAELFVEAAADGAATPLPERPGDLLEKLEVVTGLHEAASQQIVEDARRFARRTGLLVIVLLLAEAGLVAWPTARRLARLEDELTELASTDPLTGTHNRRSLFCAAEGLLRLGVRGRRPVSTIVLDIDHFKRVNDEHGHAVGDDAIRHVVDIAAGAIRDSDLIGRIGGEEFVIVCPETSAEGGAQVAEKVRSAIEATPLPLEGDQLALTVSLGVHGTLPRQGDTLDDFVAAADEALYEAKRSGRNKVIAATPRRSEVRVA